MRVILLIPRHYMPQISRRRTLAAAALGASCVVAFPHGARAQTSDVPTLVTTQWLAAHIADPHVVVIGVGQDRAAFDSLHVRGARFLPFRSYASVQNGLATEIPPTAVLDSVLESVGVSTDSRIVVYGAAVGSHRLFLALDVMGFRGRVGLLEGGVEQWHDEGRPTASGAPEPVKPGTLELKPRDDVIVNRAWVESHLKEASVQLLDARGGATFDAGHIPGAVNLHFTEFVQPGATSSTFTMVSADSARRIFEHAGFRKDAVIVPYCAVGEVASVVYFTARLLGLPVKFFDGSMQEWQRAPAGPTEGRK